ncbi:T9SS type A sorting domain-containing protein [Hymenobacter sp. HMF4947]|uniref:T9SS type A sorting domain-containing protein n=1 Tax=Hymenobacter ginkgonis TaxID=2682976 RepID=A0A7K1TE06_9BACT|nr:T9SS type A sorting domain-containing protein [Hymenobacter ginkgonis]MVN76639.1 T9SS type A sorting domain-containing protein [Hymenobacter ginkgonis]
MQNTPTLFRKVSLNWLPWRIILPILAIVASLWSPSDALAQTQYNNAVTITQRPTLPAGGSAQAIPYAGRRAYAPYNTYTRLGNPNATPIVATPGLGTYDLNGNSTLTISDGIITVGTSPFNAVTGATLLYRVYLTGTPIGQLPNLSRLTLQENGTDAFGVVYKLPSGTPPVDLLAGLTSGGTYTIDIQFELSAADGSPITDPSGSYNLSFSITPPAVTPAGGTTTWQGISRGMDANGPVTLPSDTDWNNKANWSNGVPTRLSNAVIPAKTSSAVVYPILNDPSATYEVNNLTMQGNSGSSAAQLVINVATLRVYGNLLQPGGGLSGNITGNGPLSTGVTNSQTNSTLVFAGADQVITGQLLVSDIIIAGSGIKSVINVMIPSNIIAFQPASVTAGVVIQSAAQDLSSGTVNTVFDTTGNSYIQLVSSSVISLKAGEAETNTSYIKGVTRADRNLVAGVQNTFGNIGLDITANHTPGNIFVYRVVGDALTGPVATNAVPVKRQFKIVGDDNSESAVTATSNIDVIFHYLDSADELNTIKEENLTMFRSKVNGAPYQPVAGSLNQTNNTVTRLALPSLTTSYITLGDKTNPLPVSLTAFTATRSNQNAVLAWTTASELNNAGFEVQVSNDGTAFRKLTFVTSKSPNSSQTINYSYTDTETNKLGIRYYRLRQVDTDGEDSYSPVRALSFDGAAVASATLSAYPNPFSNKIDFNLDATTVGSGVAHVQVMDMAGRTVREQNLSVANASLTLDGLDNLRSGVYIAKVTLANGSTQTVRIQKQ